MTKELSNKKKMGKKKYVREAQRGTSRSFPRPKGPRGGEGPRGGGE